MEVLLTFNYFRRSIDKKTTIYENWVENKYVIKDMTAKDIRGTYDS
jgi:hypothetical protein